MLTLILFPTNWQIKLNSIEKQFGRVVISVQTTNTTSTCPSCHTHAHRVHGHYSRHPIDLPICGYTVELNFSVRRFCCDNRKCRRTTFAESMQKILNRYARRTHRLTAQQHHVAFELGGRAGARLLAKLSMDTSRDTLIKMIRNTPELDCQTPRVLGVDDWAFRKGESYGTVLVDLETHQVIDLLPERNAKSLALWLAKHPGVEIISRDRGKEYIKGATDGAPQALQVADRWHLMKNLREAYVRVFETKPDCLLAAADPTPIEHASDCEPLDGIVEENEMTIQNNNASENQSLLSPKTQAVDNQNNGVREDIALSIVSGLDDPTQRVSSSTPLMENASSVNPTVTMPDSNHGSKEDCQSTSAQNDVPLLNDKQPKKDCQLTACDESLSVPKMTCADQQTHTQSVGIDEPFASADKEKTAPSLHKQHQFAAVKQLQQQGFSQREISRRLKMNRRTVKKYIEAQSCPMPRSRVKRARLIDGYQSYIIKRVKEGYGNAKAILSELQQQGFLGQYGTVARFVAEVKAAGLHPTSAPKPKKPWSPKRVAWLLVKREAELTDDEKNALLHIKRVDSTVQVTHTLGQRFLKMIRQANPEALSPWLQDVAESSIPALKNFAKGIKADLDAVTNALKLPWSQGQTEGQVNRLKLIKRQMYGRANFDLLRKRVIGSPTPG